jgi:hypothetical protein
LTTKAAALLLPVATSRSPSVSAAITSAAGGDPRRSSRPRATPASRSIVPAERGNSSWSRSIRSAKASTSFTRPRLRPWGHAATLPGLPLAPQ